MTENASHRDLPGSWGTPPTDAHARAEWVAARVRAITGAEVRALPPGVEVRRGDRNAPESRRRNPRRDPRLLALDLAAKVKPLEQVLEGTPRLDRARRELALLERGYLDYAP